MLGKSVSCAAILALALSFPAHAADPGPTTSAEDNLAYAVGEICAPFVFDHVEPSKLPIGRPFVVPDGLNEPVFTRQGITAIRVGVAGFIHVGLNRRGGFPSCEFFARGADPQSLRQAVLDVLATRPERFAPARSRYLPGRFDTEDMLCAAADSAHPGGSVLLSSPRREERDRIALLLTISDDPRRGEPCDKEGVRLNYRTLAP